MSALSSAWQPRSAEHLTALEDLKGLTVELFRALLVPASADDDRRLFSAWSAQLDEVNRLARQPRDPEAPVLEVAEALTLCDHADRAALVRHALELRARARGTASKQAALELLKKRLTLPLQVCG